MPGLHRIILINCHLPGFVELDVNGHSNICGTNASGKTTLQRLIPVFYGELPSKVVPKTRKKFDEFYLPHSNSYLIYEYQREEGQHCQVVLTRKGNEGVQYRFVDAAYASEQLLVEGDNNQAQAMLPEQWVKQLKQLSINYSHKIQATSEYRCIIQNDPTVGLANRKENTKLRQLAGRYSLVAAKHRIRHMEKLVSAVHAKEGKMDTLRTMLAAIFEEDGLVQPTTTVKNSKARDWITQMRQTMRLQDLHQEFQRIELQSEQLTTFEHHLRQLKPVLLADQQELTTQKADAGEQAGQLKKRRQADKYAFEQQENKLNSEISANDAELYTKSNSLDNIQSQYDHYLDSDLVQLQKDTDNLPLWRETLDEKQQQYRILIDQHNDLANQLEQQKLKLAESLERLAYKNQTKAKGINQQKEQLRKQQQGKEAELRSQYDHRKEEQAEDFEQALQVLQQQIMQLEYQVKHPTLSAQEQDDRELAETRLALAQRNWQQCSAAKNQAEHSHREAQQSRDAIDKEVNQGRQQSRLAKEHLQQLFKQLNPEPDSLRQFLRDTQPGWEQGIGKLINEPLLERKDLAPHLLADQGSVLGVKLDLSVIDAPDYAQDELALRDRLEHAKAHLEQVEQAQQKIETVFSQQHQETELLRDKMLQQRQLFEAAEQETQFATTSKQRLAETHKELLSQQIQKAKDTFGAQQQLKSQTLDDKTRALANLKSDFEEQLLEFKAGWETELGLFDETLHELERQIDDKRGGNREQIKQLQDAFNQELANKDIDPNTLKQLKQQSEQLQNDIQRVTSRRDELREYHMFMQTQWQQQRPVLLEQDTALKSQQQQVKQRLTSLKSAYQQSQNKLTQQATAAEQKVQQLAGQLSDIQPMVNQLNTLSLSFSGTPQQDIQLGDLPERMQRCNETLENRSRAERKLKELLDGFEAALGKDSGRDFLDTMNQSFMALDELADSREKLPILGRLLSILDSRQRQIVEQGETIGGDLHKFFTVFSDINRKISLQSKRLTDEVADDLVLDGIARSEVKIISTVDELNFWTPLRRFSEQYTQWLQSTDFLPHEDYLDSLADVVEVLPNDTSYSIESLLRLELHLNEGGSDLVIKNDRQLLESSSHGMAYLILCKFLLAFTRLLRNQAQITVHWPIDEIGTLAYHNVEKLFSACDANHIAILGAFPNPESEVLMLFKHRYLIDRQKQELQKIEPKLSRIAQRLQQSRSQEKSA